MRRLRVVIACINNLHSVCLIRWVFQVTRNFRHAAPFCGKIVLHAQDSAKAKHQNYTTRGDENGRARNSTDLSDYVHVRNRRMLLDRVAHYHGSRK